MHQIRGARDWNTCGACACVGAQLTSAHLTPPTRSLIGCPKDRSLLGGSWYTIEFDSYSKNVL